MEETLQNWCLKRRQSFLVKHDHTQLAEFLTWADMKAPDAEHFRLTSTAP